MAATHARRKRAGARFLSVACWSTTSQVIVIVTLPREEIVTGKPMMIPSEDYGTPLHGECANANATSHTGQRQADGSHFGELGSWTVSRASSPTVCHEMPSLDATQRRNYSCG